MSTHQMWERTKKFFKAERKRHPEVAVVAKDLDLAEVYLADQQIFPVA